MKRFELSQHVPNHNHISAFKRNQLSSLLPRPLSQFRSNPFVLTSITLISFFQQCFDLFIAPKSPTEKRRDAAPASCSLFCPTTPARSAQNPLPSTNQLSEFEYRTLLPSSIPDEPTLIKEKGSKFITFCHHVENEDDLKAALNEIKSLHPRATHHCYAYRIGPRGEDSRANDDGEPSGSAGLPILGQLNSYDVTNVLITVVRYYGGTKLGVSGLIKAYKDGAKSILDECEIIVKELECGVIIEFDRYEDQNVIFTTLTRHNAEIVSFESLDDLEFDDGIDLDEQLAGRKQYTVTTKIKLKQRDDVVLALGELDGTSVKVV